MVVSLGDVLRQLPFGEEFCDVDWRVGAYRLKPPHAWQDCDFETVIKVVVRNSDSAERELPVWVPAYLHRGR